MMTLLLAGQLFGYILPVGAAAQWAAVSDYTDAAGSITENGNTVTLAGYGYGKYIEEIEVKEGTKLTFQIKPKTLNDAPTRQLFAVAFLNAEDSFFGDPVRDTGDGFAIHLRGFSSYASGCGVFYSAVKDGVYEKNATLGTTDGLLYNTTTNMTTTTYFFTMTRKTQVVSGSTRTWELSVYTSANTADVKTITLTDAEVPANCFADGLFVTAGVRSGTFETYDISDFTVTQPAAPLPEEAEFKIVRGYSSTAGTLAVDNGETVFTGFGGTAYSEPVADSVAVKFKIEEFPASSNWFSYGLVNKPNVFWSASNLAESQGIVTTIAPSGSNIAVSVKKLTTASMTDIGTLTAPGANALHTLTIHKQDNLWYVTLDGDDYLTVNASEVDLGAARYLVAGANGVAAMKMRATGVYMGEDMTPDMFPPVSDYTGSDLRNFTPVRGLSGAQGSITASKSSALFTGYGGASYSDAVNGGVAAKFSLHTLPAGAYWFNIGLVNKPNVFWRPDGTESQGIIALITASGNTVSASIRVVTATGLTDIGTLTAAGATDTHTLTFFKQNNKWYVSLNAGDYLTIDAANVALGDTQYLVAGANGTADMEMALSGVYIGAQMTDDMFPALSDYTGSDLRNMTVVRGYSGTAGSLVTAKNEAVLTGFGGTYYNGNVTQGMGTEFSMANVPAASYWYSISLVNQKGVFWRPDGSESHGLITMITVADNTVSVLVRNLTSAGMEDIGTLTASGAAAKHTLAFYKENGKWYITLDGATSLAIDASKVALGNTQHMVAGANGNATMVMKLHGLYIDAQVPAVMKNTNNVIDGTPKPPVIPENERDSLENFVIVRGYSGQQGSAKVSGNVYDMTGYGGCAFLSPTSTGAAVEFDLLKHPENSYWFSFGLVNKQKVFWRPDGSESQGIVTTITVSGGMIVVSVKKLTSSTMMEIGILKAEAKSSHRLAFFKQGDSWYVSLDGKTGLDLKASLIDLGDTQYLVAGASNDATMRMQIKKVYLDSKIPASWKVLGDNSTNADNAGSGKSPTGDFKIIRGYSDATGSAVLKNNVLTMTGYGGISYVVGTQDAVSADFKITKLPDTPSYWFSFGLVNGKGFWRPDGSETRGLVCTIKELNGGTIFTFSFINSNGSTALRSILSPKAVNEVHTITYFQKAGYWYVSIDGAQMLGVPAEDLDFRTLAYLCMGASSSADMEMQILAVRVGDQVPESARAGALMPYKASTSNAKKNVKDSLHTKEGGTSFTYDESLKTGTQKGSGKDFVRGGNLISAVDKELPVIIYILAVPALGALIASGIIFLKRKRFTKGRVK